MDISIFSKRLKEARRAKDFTQAQLAKQSGVTAATISAYENTDSKKGCNPSLENAAKLAEVLDVSFDWLCGLKDDRKTDTKSFKINTRDFLKSLFFLVNKCTVDKETPNYDGIVNCRYEIFVTQNRYAFSFIEDCRKLKTVLEIDVLTDEMKENLINGVIEKYVKEVNSVDELFDEGIYIENNLPFE